MRDHLSFQNFSETFYKIRTKSGGLQPFKFNRAQRYLHDRLELQKKATGKVRAIVLKGRQMGCSTLIAARDFYLVTMQEGKKAFILTHDAEATKNLFEMTRRFYENCPEGLICEPDTSSAKSLEFKAITGSYSVGTAGNKAVGRSQTVQLMHGSEVAFWPNAEEHARGILQTIADEPGTEVILESTANGMGNFFHESWQNAVNGRSDFQAIFMPWYWQDEYKTSSKDSLSEEEEGLLELYKHDGLTKEHLFWRRKKLIEFSSDELIANECFCAEYPMCATEAFRNAVTDSFIKPNSVLLARQCDIAQECQQSPLVVGVDPAITDRDRTAIIRRRGRYAYDLETHYNLNTMEIAGIVKRIIDKEHPVKVCIDCIGIGAGVVDRLREMGYFQVEGINVARRANLPDSYKNLRAELWQEMKDWLTQDIDVELPDSDELQADLCSLSYKYDSSGRLQIEGKDELKKRGLRSCDTADALMLTFSVGEYLQAAAYEPTQLPEYTKGLLI